MHVAAQCCVCCAIFVLDIFMFCLPIVDLLLLLTVRADIRMCAP